MEFRQLRYFVAVAEEANVTAAARRLNVSQPPLTRQIRQLEEDLGVTLLTRSSKGVQLTDAGKTFLAEARRMIALADAARERSQAADRGEIGHLDIGYFGSTIYSIVPSAIRRFMEAMPNVSVRIHRLSKADQLSQLRDGRLGIGFARHYRLQPDVESLCLGQEHLYIASPGVLSSKQNGKTLTLKSLDRMPLIVFPQSGRPSFADQVLEMLSRNEIVPSAIETAEDVFVALAMTMTSQAYCVVPESVAALNWPELVFAPIAEVGAISPINCIVLKHNRPPVVDAFLATLQR